MYRFLFLLVLPVAVLYVRTVSAQPAAPLPGVTADIPDSSVWSVGYARTHPGEQADYLAFLERNWVEARRRALREGVVRSYRVLVRPDVEAAEWDVMMITEYADSTAYADREAYFTSMFARPDWEARLVDGKSGRDMADLVGEELALRSIIEHR
jgi:hypothetical protein